MSAGVLLIAGIGIIMILLLCVIVWAVVARRKNVGSGEEKDQKMAIAAAAAVRYLAGYKVTPFLGQLSIPAAVCTWVLMMFLI
jgi:hypothetical protein